MNSTTVWHNMDDIWVDFHDDWAWTSVSLVFVGFWIWSLALYPS